jgi:hypothetical protein
VNKGVDPLGRLFSPVLKKAQKAATKSEETVLLADVAPKKKRAGGFCDSPSLATPLAVR